MPLALHEDGAQPVHLPTHHNLLLAAAPDHLALAPLLHRAEVPQETTLYDAGAVITHYIFPARGITSLVMDMDGGTVEVGAIGPEGMIGIPALLGVATTSTRIFTQSACTLDRVAVADLNRVMAAEPGLYGLLLRYTEAYLEEVSQSVACNRLHTLDERCARWLLITHDRTGTDEMKLKQRFLSYMLGVHRPAVSLAAGALQKAGIIRYSRGTIRILDRAALEAASCGCYERGRQAYARARLAGAVRAGREGDPLAVAPPPNIHMY